MMSRGTPARLTVAVPGGYARPVIRLRPAPARQAVLLDRRVGKHERAPLVGMTGVALVVHRFLLDHRVAERAMRIVAVGAPDLALENRVMRRLEKRRPDVLMAFAAGIGLDMP